DGAEGFLGRPPLAFLVHLFERDPRDEDRHPAAVREDEVLFGHVIRRDDVFEEERAALRFERADEIIPFQAFECGSHGSFLTIPFSASTSTVSPVFKTLVALCVAMM